MPYKPTEKQSRAWELLRTGPRHVMLVGGSRSGKTTLMIEEILCRAIQYPGSRHLLARLRFSHAKTSLWLDTLPKLLKMEGLDPRRLKWSEADHYIKLPNDSEIWVDGLDDKERVEKVLGREYNTIFFNEISQISYQSVLTLLTRLALKIPNCINKAYYDLNPVGRLHWAYRLFVQHQDPDKGAKIPNPDDYEYMVINPDDNIEHLPPGYIEDVLDRLPEHKRRRFRLGEWGDPEGVVFRNWDIIDEIPDDVMRHVKQSYGLDFGFSVDPAAWVWLGLLGDDLYLDELIYETDLVNRSLAKLMLQTKPKTLTYADSAEPKSIKELQLMGVPIRPAAKGPDSVRAGIDWLLSKNIHVTRRSGNIQMELMNYTWKTNKEDRVLPEPIDDFNHGIDSVRYGAEPFMREKKVFIGRAA